MRGLTDCISFVVMEEQNLRDALTGDHHFTQADLNALLRDDFEGGIIPAPFSFDYEIHTSLDAR